MAEAKNATQAAPELVKMTDDRLVEFAGKRKLLKSSTITASGEVQVRFDFRNGETRLYTIPSNLLLKHAAHGAEQKIGDETAGLDDVDDMVMAVDELIDRLYSGEWNAKKEAGGMSGTSMLLRALVEAYPNRTKDQLKTYLKGKTQTDKNALRASEKLAPIIKRLEAEKLSKGTPVDTGALLAELDG